MDKAARREGAKEAPMLQVLGEVIRLELREFVVGAGMEALKTLLEAERTAICGPRYEHQGARRAYRGGHTMGELVLGGRKVQVSRPRARGVEGKEEHLPSWSAFSAGDPLEKRALEQMLVGVSTRRYERSLEPTPADHHVALVDISMGNVCRVQLNDRVNDPAVGLKPFR